jgi:hypothetical protein
MDVTAFQLAVARGGLLHRAWTSAYQALPDGGALIVYESIK